MNQHSQTKDSTKKTEQSVDTQHTGGIGEPPPGSIANGLQLAARRAPHTHRASTAVGSHPATHLTTPASGHHRGVLRWHRRRLRRCMRAAARGHAARRRAPPLNAYTDAALVPALARPASGAQPRCGWAPFLCTSRRRHRRPERRPWRSRGQVVHRAPFARPATVHGRGRGRIGPLVLASRRSAGGWQKHAPGRCALGARAIPKAQSVSPELTLASRQRGARSGPLWAHAERAAPVWRCAAKRWSIGRAIGHRSVARPSREHRGRLPRPGAALERADRPTTSTTETPVGGRRRRRRHERAPLFAHPPAATHAYQLLLGCAAPPLRPPTLPTPAAGHR